MMSTGSEIDVNDMIKSTHKNAKSVESKVVQKSVVALRRKKQKQRKSSLQISKANPKLKSKSGIRSSSKSKEPVPARNAPSSTFIPNRSVLSEANQEEIVLTAELPIVRIGNSELPTHENNYQLYLSDFLDTNFETGPIAKAATSQSQYLPPNPHISYEILGATPQSTLEPNSQCLLQQILDGILKLTEIVLQEKKCRQESEARIQVNLDLINNHLSNKFRPSSQTHVIDRKKISNEFKLPITEREQVGGFNKYLSDNPEYKESLINILSRLGGRNHQSKLRVAMRYIIKDSVLKEFTWKGTRDKDPFIVFSHINEILTDVVHTPDDPYTTHDHNKAMVVYVKQAPFRFKADEKRRIAKDNGHEFEYDDDNDVDDNDYEYEDENDNELGSDSEN